MPVWFLCGAEATKGLLSRDICAMDGGADGEVNTHLPTSLTTNSKTQHNAAGKAEVRGERKAHSVSQM